MTGLEERIQKMCESRRLAHGLLFTGSGEDVLLSSAKKIARYFSCEAQAGKPCGRCLGCLKVEEGNHPDCLVIEPEKQETTIEQIRELQLWVARAPYEAPAKVAIVRKAETMNAAAGNSLLKTLEEPPAHGYLILTTSMPDALLKTILSRVQQIRFPETSENAGIPDPTTSEWFETFQNLADRKIRPSPEAIFDLTSEVSEDKETLRLFFHAMEERLRDELINAQASGASLAKISLLDSVFSDTLRAERDLLARYGNAALTLDSLLSRWLCS
jgi:DNA polymerase III delta' subunit